MQGQAEAYLERLHGVTEKELEILAIEETKVDFHQWAKFRERLIGLTDVTKSHFEKLVQVSHRVSGYVHARETMLGCTSLSCLKL